MQRKQTWKNKKFNITVDNKKGTDDDTTYLDSLYTYLNDIGIDGDDIKKLAEFLNGEQFDSEAVNDDFDDGNNGNIRGHIENKKCIEFMKNFIQTMNSMYCTYI